ncbi:MAG: tetratricopeptide repeat protein [Verrucomicrobiota bacterium]
MDRPQPYYAASSYYMEGDLTRAAESLKTILEKNPLASPANILMAKIEVSRGKPEAAIGYLKKARETTLDQKEIDAWIVALERTSSPGNIPHSP